MIRLSYISKFSRELGPLDLANIEVVSKHNNKKRGIRGALLCFGDMFFQTLEGERQKVMELYETIRKDDRHDQVTLLDIEEDVDQSEFKDWDMNMINLDKTTQPVMQPIRGMLAKLAATFERLDQSHNVLKSYTPASVINMIQDGKRPLEEPLRKTEKIVLFTDLVAFSTMSSHLSSERVISMLNRYAEIVIDCIEDQGGEVGKLIGDGVMAYFDGDQADQAIRAAVNILHALKSEREASDSAHYLRAMYGGVGLARGDVIQGNMGSSKRLDYTIIGDTVNLASLLEEMTRTHNQALILSGDVLEASALAWNSTSLGTLESDKLERTVEMFTIEEATVHEMVTREQVLQLLEESKEYLEITA
jgi:class 3 adenylate cyclase